MIYLPRIWTFGKLKVEVELNGPNGFAIVITHYLFNPRDQMNIYYWIAHDPTNLIVFRSRR